MKTDPRCTCTDCIINKMEEAIREPIPNRVKLEKIRMEFINVVNYEKYKNREITNEELKMIDLIEKIDCYDDIDNILLNIDMIRLHFSDVLKINGKKAAFKRKSLGLPIYKVSDNQKRIYKKLDSVKTIFDVKEIG